MTSDEFGTSDRIGTSDEPGRRASTHGRMACVLVFAMAVAALSGCGSGLDPEEAKTQCDTIRATDSTCVDDAAYESCLACYEDCGVDCAQLESCPLQFTCD